MARTSRSREIDAPVEAVWQVIADPRHLPRWWPGVTRVQDVRQESFTQVVPTKRGKPMRLDFLVTESVAMERRSWSQSLPGTPFERLLEAWSTTVTLTELGDRTLVTIEEIQRLRGSFRLGLPLQRRPARRRVDGALAGLAEVLR
jgi:uncharacterized protein YndB with AHSA1/START domain